MAELSTWLPWGVVLAVVLYVWRRLDARMDRLDARIDGVDARIDGVDARIDGLRAVGAVSERLARLEGAAFGPWPARPPDPPEASPAS